MPMPTRLIKCSSRLLQRRDVIGHIKTFHERNALRFLGGGGEQITAEFERRGWKTEFGPFGRICKDEEQRLVAEMILKMNATLFEDELQKAGVFGSMVLPVLDNEVGQVTCHVNADLYPIICYNGYDFCTVYTMEQDVIQKIRYYRVMWQIHRLHLANRSIPDVITVDPDDHPSKIEVVGFPELRN